MTYKKNQSYQETAPIGYQPTKYQKRYLELEELLEFAVETGQIDSPNLVREVKNLKKVLFYAPPETLNIENLCNAEAELEKHYATLSELLSPVTILTLRTTSEDHPVHRPWWQALFLGTASVGRNFFRKLFWVGLLLIILIFLREYTLNPATLSGTSLSTIINPFMYGMLIDILKFIDPFLYGALGALVYVYKDLNKHYIERTLHPKKLATNWLRLFMGALAGGLIVNLFSSFLNNTIPGTKVPSVAVGFLAGYSVDFFYKTLDMSIRAIIPGGKAPRFTNPRQAQIELLTKSLKEMTNEDDKAVIRHLLEKL